MDFHSLARKDLQSLCKKNKIPANLTNVAMADALTALPEVEGLDELGNAQQSPERTITVDPRTAVRNSTRRKLVKVEPESSQILTQTRRTTRRAVAGNESNNVKLPETPAGIKKPRVPAAASTRRKIDSQLIECGEDEKIETKEKSGVAETPAIPSSRKKAEVVYTRRKVETNKDEKSVQRVYGTRHSVRVLEKTMEKLSLKEEKKVEAVKIEGLCDEIEAKAEPDESLENECEAVEDSKTNGDEVDQLPKIECEMKHMVNEDNESEVAYDENQNIAQFLGSESETKGELSEDSIGNVCAAKLETESSANSDNLSDTYIQVETSDKEIESIDEKGVEITENPENTMNSSDMEMEMEKESEGNNQNESNNSSPFAMEADRSSIPDVPAESSDLVIALTAKGLPEDVSNTDGFNTDAIDAQTDSDWQEIENEPESNQYQSKDSSSFVMEAESTSTEAATEEISALVNTLTDEKPTEDESKTLEMNQQNERKVESNADDLDTEETDSNDAQTDSECHEDNNNIINKENIENGKDDDKLFDMSLRQLTKALKEKLQIKNKNDSKVGNRQALQILPENDAEA